MTKQWYC